MVLHERQKRILEYIVRDYIRTAVPVSSGKISESDTFESSPATIRNVMLELDEKGYIVQPHTSAGRIPTEKGYHYFIKYCTTWRDPSLQAQRELSSAALRTEKEPQEAFDEISKTLARHLRLFSGVSLWGEHERLFAHGLGEVFKEPEFEEHDTVLEFTRRIEHLHEELRALRARSHDDETSYAPDVSVGTFGVVSMSFHSRDGTSYTAFSMGPKRMNYEHAGSLLRYLARQL